MKAPTAADAKYGFGRLIGPARAEPVVIAKLGRPAVAIMAVEDYEQLTEPALEDNSASRGGQGSQLAADSVDITDNADN